jgi:predicted nuclease of predicted toxin-antitoxin system
MKFVADENIDLPLIARLRKDGHNVHAVIEMSAGISDNEVLKQANQQGVVLLTADKDFGELVYRDRKYTCGIVLIRLSGLMMSEKVEIVANVIREHGSELGNAFTVISQKNLRIRPRI